MYIECIYLKSAVQTVNNIDEQTELACGRSPRFGRHFCIP